MLLGSPSNWTTIEYFSPSIFIGLSNITPIFKWLWNSDVCNNIILSSSKESSIGFKKKCVFMFEFTGFSSSPLYI